MKNEQEIKDRIEIIEFCINICRTHNLSDLIKYTEEKNTLEWVLGDK